MWLVRIVLLVVLVVGLVMLALQNNYQVNARFFGKEFVNIELFWVMFACTLGGFLIGLLLAALREVKLRMELSRLRKQRGTLQHEVEQLRAAPLHDLEPKPASELPAPRIE